VTTDAKAQEVLDNYNKDLERWKERNGHYKDIQPLSTNDVLYIRQMLHPTKKAESKKVTEQLIVLLCEREIITAKEIYEATGLSDKPVLNRMKLFQQFGLIRRESKKYYLPTPRMHELRKRYLRRICT
jgi:hypothetical protein